MIHLLLATCRSKEKKWSLSVLMRQLVYWIPWTSVCSEECGWIIVS